MATAKKDTAAVEVRDGSALFQISASEAALAYKVLQGEVVPDYSPEDMARAIAARIQDADSDAEVDAIFASQEDRKLAAWRDVLMGEPVKVLRLHFNPSAFDGQPVYAVCDLEKKDDGTVWTVGIGGLNVLYQLVKMVEKARTDRWYKLVAVRTTSGFDTLWLEEVKSG